MKKRIKNQNISFYQDLMKKALTGEITKEQAIAKIEPGSFLNLFQKKLVFKNKPRNVLVGVSLSPGLAVGQLVIDPNRVKNEKNAILIKEEIFQQDFQAVGQAAGLVILKGGATSPGILMAKSLGIPAIIVQEKFVIDQTKRQLRVKGKTIKPGKGVVLDAQQGILAQGQATISQSAPTKLIEQITNFIQSLPNNVLAFAGNPKKVKQANQNGFGVAIRSEELLTSSYQALSLFQRTVLAISQKQKTKYLKTLLNIQVKQYEKIFSANQDQPIIIRLLDPPFSEFFPSTEELLTKIIKLKEELQRTKGKKNQFLVSKQLKNTKQLLSKVEELAETTPMLGHRGCRLAITNPELYQTQVEAIFRAQAFVLKKGIKCLPNLSIPMVVDPKEVTIVKRIITKTAKKVAKATRITLTYKVGVAIETPRAVSLAKSLAKQVDFFSFGTNDLTQLVLGLSRTDKNDFLIDYQKAGIIESNPFTSLDPQVVEYINQTVTKALSVKKNFYFFLALKNISDVVVAKGIIKNKGYIVCPSSLAPAVKLAMSK